MKAGQLVKVSRASIGAPAGSIGLIVGVLHSEAGFGIYTIQMNGGKEVRRLCRDLEVISG